MKKEKWSDYAKYLVLADKSSYQLGCSFPRYLNFKKIREVFARAWGTQVNWQSPPYALPCSVGTSLLV